MQNQLLLEKYKRLKEYLGSLKSAAVAFSGGVDSTFLLYAAKEALGAQMIAVTAALHSVPASDLEEAAEYCRKLGVRHVICRINELDVEGFAQNPPNRCYLCKTAVFGQLKAVAAENGMAAVAEGSNTDDLGDYRPGRRAIEELSVKSPLLACGFSKQDIRDMSKILGVPTWNKPSFACLSSRVPYGEEITAEKLSMVEQGEAFLKELGFRQFRVRIHGKVARIELLPEDFERFMREEIRLSVYERLRKIGFDYAALDLKGFRTGSMNEVLK